MKVLIHFMMLICCSMKFFGQQSANGSFIATLGTDTVIVETYNLMPNHLFGKAFLRYPQDQIGIFDFHFYPDGSIKHYSMSLMKPDSSYVNSGGTQGVYCENDTCTWFASWPGAQTEYSNKRPAKEMNYIGGWTPTLSLIEWNCMRLIKSGKQSLPITMINDYIGIRQVAVSKGKGDTIIFGGDFLEYTKIRTTPEGKIIAYDGTGTPWNYKVTRHAPIDVDAMAKRMSLKPKIGIPSPEVKVTFAIQNDTIRLSYGRPSKRGRKIFGGIVPYDSIWRTGAGDPTKITFPYDVQFGKTVIPKGQYSLYTIPRTGQWSLIFNTDLKQWPTEPNRSKDYAIIPMNANKPSKQTEQFTITIEPSNKGGTIRMVWDETEISVPFEVIKNKSN
jgi:hypothetical protein